MFFFKIKLEYLTILNYFKLSFRYDYIFGISKLIFFIKINKEVLLLLMAESNPVT